MLDQNEPGDQLWLQLSPLNTDSTLIQPHNLSLKQRRIAALPSFESNLYGHLQQRPAR
ncbi:MAG TPA: hypothetical protein VGI23_20825 [Steroidobacteraceae bacterium]